MKTVKDIPCPVCNTENQFRTNNSFEFCSVCGWQSDGVQYDDPNFPGANDMTLNEACRIWESGQAIYPNRYPRQNINKIFVQEVDPIDHYLNIDDDEESLFGAAIFKDMYGIDIRTYPKEGK